MCVLDIILLSEKPWKRKEGSWIEGESIEPSIFLNVREGSMAQLEAESCPLETVKQRQVEADIVINFIQLIN